MVYHELVITVFCNENITMERNFEILARFTAQSMLLDEKLKILHGQNGFKLYTMSGLYPVENEKIYQKGRVYIFNIRSLNVEFILKMKQAIMKVSNEPLKAMATEIRLQNYRFISEIHSISPAVATVNNHCWLPEDGMGLLMQRVHSNAVRKLKSFNPDFEEPTDNFISSISLQNQKPIKIEYKRTSLLGCKLSLSVKEDETSQKLAFTVMATGILEKNSIGLGFCRAE